MANVVVKTNRKMVANTPVRHNTKEMIVNVLVRPNTKNNAKCTGQK